MQVNQYLTKTFKGRYIETLEDFLRSLDADYDWRSFHFCVEFLRKKPKDKYFFCYINNRTYSLILAEVHKVGKTGQMPFFTMMIDGQQQIVRNENFYLVQKVSSKEIPAPINDIEDIMISFEEMN